MIEAVQTTRLSNGLTILTENMPGLRSVSLGIWVRRGARHETPPLNGICHFIEHAVFKGTRQRSALDIAIESDRLGGHLDAFTTHEMTGFTMKVADTGATRAFALLADMLAQPRFDAKDLKLEQRVIIEEMKMVEDTPDEYLGEIFNAAYFPDHPLGRPIEGTAKTVAQFNRKKVQEFHAAHYTPRNLVIAAAGNIEREQLVEMAVAAFSAEAPSEPAAPSAPPAVAAPIVLKRKTDLEQAHMLLATPWPSATDANRYAASLLAAILGGGTSSRLWQAIREERGLAYSVGAGATAFSDVGVFSIYAGTSPDQVDEVVDLSLAEMRRIVREAVTEAELQLYKEQSVSAILLGLESSSARAGTLARQEIVHGCYIAPDTIIQRLEAVTIEDVQRIAQAYFRTENMAFAALGNLNGFKMDRNRLEI